MRYLGGKSRIAKEIAQIVAPQGFWWEPFCGGLSVSVQLAKYGPGLISDANPALISLYTSVARGWLPPEALTEEEYKAAKSLPDSDPRKAFAGFGCSFGGKWFGGRAQSEGRNYAAETARALRADLRLLAPCHFRLLSFLALDPATFAAAPECIYADPPYAGTTGYAAIGAFDHGKFWAYCRGWAEQGVRVFVSEYACPVGSDVVWEKRHARTVGIGTARLTADHADAPLERLFRVHAPSVARVA